MSVGEKHETIVIVVILEAMQASKESQIIILTIPFKYLPQLLIISLYKKSPILLMIAKPSNCELHVRLKL